MKVKVVNADHRVPMPIWGIKHAVRYFAEKLSIDPKYTVTVDFDRDNFLGDDIRNIANAVVDEDKTPVTEFFIELNTRCVKTRTGIVKALAHEMVHIRQFAEGHLVLRPKFAIWKSQKIDYSDMNYFEYPWEIEAYGWEYGLVNRYIASVKGELACLNRPRK